MILDHLTKAPFNLDAAALAWVRTSFEKLTPEEKLAQLFTLRSAGSDAAEIERQQRFRPGGITRQMGPDAAAERAILAGFNAKAPVPLLISADLEGGRMSLPFGTEVPNPLALAAVDDVVATTEISRIMAAEAKAAGINWTFTPVLDVNAAFRSAIVATRGFGSDVAAIERHALAQLGEFQKAGVAATVKHWPGEGFDDRDQHLVTTVNPLSVEAWEAVFGRLYRAAIEAGVLSVMSAHIALPAFVRSIEPEAGLEAFRPASVSRLLNQVLLRERLGFNGLIVSDATSMAGLGSWSSREQSIPEVISSGCDVILFSSDPETDVGYLEAALADGRLSWDRVDDAVLRQLALKAAVGLHREQRADISQLGSASSRSYAEEVTRRAPTLVKDTQNLLPLDPGRHRRVLVITPGIVFPFLPQPLPFALPEMLREKGFEVTLHEPSTEVSADRFDLVLYLFGDETLLTRSHIFIDWLKIGGQFGKAMQRYWHDIPTLMISFGYPYLLYDAPRVPTYINAYSTTESMQRAVVEALLGNVAWNRNSPVDPFCGLEDARF
jgi:beta-N-acetylhexosaminidase